MIKLRVFLIKSVGEVRGGGSWGGGGGNLKWGQGYIMGKEGEGEEGEGKRIGFYTPPAGGRHHQGGQTGGWMDECIL